LLERHDIRERPRLEIHSDVGLEQLRLDELRKLERRRVTGRNEQLEFQRALADVSDELFRSVRVGLRPGLEVRVVREVRRRDRAVADEADALSRTAVQDLVAIDRHGDSLHVALLVEDVALRLVRDHAVERKRSDLLVVQRRVRLHRGDVLAVDQVDELNVPGAEVREAHVSVRDDLDGHLVEVWELVPVRILAPPVGVLLERVVVVLDRLGEDERSGSSLERLEVKSAPTASTTFRETIIPARSTSAPRSGANADLRLNFT